MQHWHILSGKEDDDEEENGEELSLTAFEGVCYKCGKRGHQAYQCPEKKSEAAKFVGEC